MGPTEMPDSDHAEFDQLCGGLDEYDTMPNPHEDASRLSEFDEPEEQLDDQILGGLVSP